MKGWGVIRKRGSGYQVDIRLGPERFLKSYPTRTLADDVLRELRKKKAMGDIGLPGLSSSPTYSDLIPRLLTAYEASNFTRRTLQTYRQQLDHLEKQWGKRRVMDTRPSDVQEWSATLAAKGYSVHHIRGYLDRLSALHEWALDNGSIHALPCRIKRPTQGDNKGGPAIPEDDLAALLSVSTGRVRLAYLLAADAGLRKDELVQLKPSDIGARVMTVLGKGRKLRYVPVYTVRLADALKADPVGWANQDEMDKAARPSWLAVYPDTPTRGSAKWHMLRRRFATVLLASGVPADQVRRALGHSDLKTTARYNDAHPLAPSAAWSTALESNPMVQASKKG